jgi:hypothetical protein
MKTVVNGLLGLVISLGITGIAVAENNLSETHEVYAQIRAMEHSVSHSSVSQHLSAEVLEESQDKLARARMQAKIGNYITAHQLVSTVGQHIYTMNNTNIPVSGYSSREMWIQEMIQSINSIMPVADQIAAEKNRGQDMLSVNQALYRDGLAALKAGDTNSAEILIKGAYKGLQQVVSNLRSGDQLTVALPAENTPEAWQDAARRYNDWLYTSEKLVEMSQINTMEADEIREMLDAAGSRYGKALALADSHEWGQAVATLDDAFLIMENSWRVLGIEI